MGDTDNINTGVDWGLLSGASLESILKRIRSNRPLAGENIKTQETEFGVFVNFTPEPPCCAIPLLKADQITTSLGKCGYPGYLTGAIYKQQTIYVDSSNDFSQGEGVCSQFSNTTSTHRIDMTDWISYFPTCETTTVACSGTGYEGSNNFTPLPCSSTEPWEIQEWLDGDCGMEEFPTICGCGGACSAGNSEECNEIFGNYDEQSDTFKECAPADISVDCDTETDNPIHEDYHFYESFTLEEEFTTEDLITKLYEKLATLDYDGSFIDSFEAHWVTSNPISESTDEDIQNIDIARFRYKFEWEEPLERDCTFCWIERTIYYSEEGRYTDEQKCETVGVGGTETAVYEILEPIEDARPGDRRVSIFYPVGACCVNGGCVTIDQSYCQGVLGGVWKGPFGDDLGKKCCKENCCDPDPCGA